jgi:hypothetical protein
VRYAKWRSCAVRSSASRRLAFGMGWSYSNSARCVYQITAILEGSQDGRSLLLLGFPQQDAHDDEPE